MVDVRMVKYVHSTVYVCMCACACVCECNMVATIYNIQLVCVCVCVCLCAVYSTFRIHCLQSCNFTLKQWRNHHPYHIQMYTSTTHTITTQFNCLKDKCSMCTSEATRKTPQSQCGRSWPKPAHIGEIMRRSHNMRHNMPLQPPPLQTRSEKVGGLDWSSVQVWSGCWGIGRRLML